MVQSIAVAVIAVGLFMTQAPSQVGYGDGLSVPWRRTFGLTSQSGPYWWVGYPSDSLGLAFVYAEADNGYRPLCMAWDCLGLEQGTVQAQATQRLTLNGLASVWQLKSVPLSPRQQLDLGVRLLLPGFAHAVRLVEAPDWTHQVVTKVALGPVFRRSVTWKNLLSNESFRHRVSSGGRAYVGEDIVAAGAVVSISIDPVANRDVELALSKTARATPSPGQTWRLTPRGLGHYRLEVDQPLVLAVQVRRTNGSTLERDALVNMGVFRGLPVMQ